MHAAMQYITVRQNQTLDLFLVQEPWWERVNNVHATASFPGWQVILPKRPLKEDERPRVAAFYRLGVPLEVTLRNDIATDTDVMILDIKREGSTNPPTRMINLYNQKPLGEQYSEWTIDRLARANLDPSTPTVITGDWNARHPSWDDGVETACPRTRQTLEWIEGNGYTLCNDPFVPTREDTAGHVSVIDLTFKNETANGMNIVSGHIIDTTIGALSDHHALLFNIGNPEEVVYNVATNNLNWKHAIEAEFTSAIIKQLEMESEEHTNVVSQILNPDRIHATPDELDRATNWIHQLLEHAATKAVPTRRICERSKPWWTPELSRAYHDLREAREHLHGWMRDFHTPSIFLAERVKESRKRTLKLVKSAKNEYYNKMVEEANPHTIWTYRKWTKNSRTYTAPPLDRGEDRPHAITHAEKCDTLRENLFPEPAPITDEPPIDLEPCNEDIEYTSVTKREVKDAIFTAAQLNAPGISGLTGRAWRWAWSTLHEEMFHLIRLCADSGYHPKIWRTSIAVALQKPNRDYSKPRSYRLVQLLEVLGKTLERIQARRLSYIAAKYHLFPSTQYGGISGRSAQDAVLTIVHDIEAAWNHNRATTMLTFDITGYFDNIPHGYLIDTLRNHRIPLPIVKWVHSFIQERQATICLDGKRDGLKPIRTGVPQGSCTSPILAAYFTSPMNEAIARGTREKLENEPELSDTINVGKAGQAPLTIYVDDGLIAASAHDRRTSTKIAEIAFHVAHEWLSTRGMKIDQGKSELIHFTRSNRGRHSGDGPSITIPTNSPGELRTINPVKVIRYLGIWLDSHLNLAEHVQKTTSKAITAAHSLRLLGNSVRGLHQTHARQLYLGAILPIATYGLPIFWKSKRGRVLTTLTTMQNKCLRMITGAFRTTNTPALEIEASIPPIDIWLDYKLDLEALCISRLANDHPIMCRVYPDQRDTNPPTTTPPLQPFDHTKRYRGDPRSKFTTCITRISKRVLDNTERTRPHPEPPGGSPKSTYRKESNYSSQRTHQESRQRKSGPTTTLNS